MASDWAYKKAKDLSDRGWLGEAEFEEEQEDHIYTVAQALREARAEGMRGAVKLLESDEAAHTCYERGGYFKHWTKNHVGPSLMAASLWAKWLRTKVTGEEPTK